jgi:hypothetical protein
MARRKWTPGATMLPKYSEQSGREGKHTRFMRPFLRHEPNSETMLDTLWLTMGGATSAWCDGMTAAEAKAFNARWKRTARELGVKG